MQFPKKIKSPHKFVIEKNGQYLFYYGGNHVNEVKHPMFEDIQKFWNDFLSKIGPSKYNALVLVEGGKRKLYPTIEESIKNDGEAGFITFIASKAGIPVDSPEPTRKLIDGHLLKKFTRDQIQYYYFAQIVNQYLSFHANEDSTSYFEVFLENDRKESGWSDFEFTIDNMKKIHEQLFNRKFDLLDKVFFNKVVNPTISDTVINEIASEVSEMRDKCVVNNVIDRWKDKYNIFVLFSYYHAYKQENVLRNSLIKKQ